MSLFISFEGGEGSGKSTQAQILQQHLEQSGLFVLPIHEPGTTPLGLYLRDRLKREISKKQPVSHGAELFMFAAARAELVATIVQPTLEQTKSVIIADRYADSTIAYQGYGRQLPLDDVAAINRIATKGIWPDLTFLLDCPPEQGLKRLSPQFMLPLESNESAARIDLAGSRRFEEESLEFHRRVRAGYQTMAKQDPARWCVIDATKTVEEISDTIWELVQESLGTE